MPAEDFFNKKKLLIPELVFHQVQLMTHDFDLFDHSLSTEKIGISRPLFTMRIPARYGKCLLTRISRKFTFVFRKSYKHEHGLLANQLQT